MHPGEISSVISSGIVMLPAELETFTVEDSLRESATASVGLICALGLFEPP